MIGNKNISIAEIVYCIRIIPWYESSYATECGLIFCKQKNNTGIWMVFPRMYPVMKYKLIVWLYKIQIHNFYAYLICIIGVAITSWKLLQISTKLSFTSLMMKPISIFWSDESPGRTRSAHVACAQLLSRLAGHSVCGLGIHLIKKSKWVSSLGLKNLAFQKFAVISMTVHFFLATPKIHNLLYL